VAAVPASCGPGNDADGEPCAVSNGTNSCVKATGDCSFVAAKNAVAAVAADSRCVSETGTCKFVPAGAHAELGESSFESIFTASNAANASNASNASNSSNVDADNGKEAADSDDTKGSADSKKKLDTRLLELTVTYDQTPRQNVGEIKEPLLEPPRVQYVAGIVMSSLSMNFAELGKAQNPEELFFDADDAEPFPDERIIITNIVPDSPAGRNGGIEAGKLVHSINNIKITNYESLCKALAPLQGTNEELAKKHWTLRTKDSFTVLNAWQVYSGLFNPEQFPKSTACKCHPVNGCKPRDAKLNPKNMNDVYAEQRVKRKARISELQVKAQKRRVEITEKEVTAKREEKEHKAMLEKEQKDELKFKAEAKAKLKEQESKAKQKEFKTKESNAKESQVKANMTNSSNSSGPLLENVTIGPHTLFSAPIGELFEDFDKEDVTAFSRDNLEDQVRDSYY
jgi:hypothetical protein